MNKSKTPKLKRDKVRIAWFGTTEGRMIDGYRYGDSFFIHRSVNRGKRHWTVTHNGTGHLLIDSIRSRKDAVACMVALTKCVRTMRTKYAATFK